MLGPRDIGTQLSSDLWTPELMAIAIAAKQESRAQKGLGLNCFVLDRSNPSGDELVKFLDGLKQNLGQIPTGTRIQLAVRTDVHWTAFDVMVDNGKLKVLCFDAYGDPRGGKALDLIAKKIPDTERYILLPSQKIDPKTDNVRDMTIQTDSISCSRFTLDHMFHLANMDTFGILEKHKGNLSSFHGEIMLRLTQLPKEFASLLRDTQSWTTLKEMPGHLAQVFNKKGQSVYESAFEHRKEVNGKLQNHSIDYKRKVFEENITSYMSKHNAQQLDTIVTNRAGQKFIQSPQNYLQEREHEVLRLQDPKVKLINNIERSLIALENFSRDEKNPHKDRAVVVKDIKILRDFCQGYKQSNQQNVDSGLMNSLKELSSNTSKELKGAFESVQLSIPKKGIVQGFLKSVGEFVGIASQEEKIQKQPEGSSTKSILAVVGMIKEQATGQSRSLEEKPKPQTHSPAMNVVPSVGKSIDTTQSLPPPTQRASSVAEVSVPRGPK